MAAAKKTARKSVVILGDVMTDISMRVRDPLHLGSDTAASCVVTPGGSGANQAMWLARTGRVDVHFIGCVGADLFGRVHQESLAAAGMVAHLASDSTRATGMVIVLIDATGERTMITDRGANDGLRREHLPLGIFQRGSWFHLSGYTLLAPETRPIALECLALARRRGMRLSVDPASTAPLSEAGPGNFLEWTQGADLLFPNLEEGRLLSGETDVEAVARTLSEHYGGVALKLGPRGAVWAARGQPAISMSAEALAEVDSTGAGDAFGAGFLSSWLSGGTPEEALTEGARLALAAVSARGGRPPGERW
jgi:sugar/nucleoside kinase (ribokinase family)